MSRIQQIIAELGGRKFVMAVATAVAIVLQEKLGIAPEQVMYIAGVAATFILGQGLADGLSHGATSSTTVVEDDS